MAAVPPSLPADLLEGTSARRHLPQRRAPASLAISSRALTSVWWMGHDRCFDDVLFKGNSRIYNVAANPAQRPFPAPKSFTVPPASPASAFLTSSSSSNTVHETASFTYLGPLFAQYTSAKSSLEMHFTMAIMGLASIVLGVASAAPAEQAPKDLFPGWFGHSDDWKICQNGEPRAVGKCPEDQPAKRARAADPSRDDFPIAGWFGDSADYHRCANGAFRGTGKCPEDQPGYQSPQ